MLNEFIMRMKKILLFFAAAFMAAGVASAQDINKAIELANGGNEAFQMGEYQLAIDAFKNSLSVAEGLGEAGAEHANTCKTAICNIYLANAKNLIKVCYKRELCCRGCVCFKNVVKRGYGK